MDCKHDQYKCTDNRFFCLICGAEIADPFAVKDGRAEKPAETQKTGRKRKAAKADK